MNDQYSESQWQEIIDRIAKVQALADSPNINEAAAAAAMLQRLLFKYNVELAEVERRSGERVKRHYEREDFDVGIQVWKRQLLAGIARANFCKTIWISRTKKQSLVGERHNIQVAWYLYDYLSSEIERLSEDGFATREDRHFTDKRSWKIAFARGAVSVIRERLKAQQQQDQAETGESTALVLVQQDKALDLHYRSLFPHVQFMRHSYSDNPAYQRGKQAGHGISLEKQIDGRGRLALSS